MHTVAQAAARPNPADSQRLLGQNSAQKKKKINKTKQDGADRDGKVRRRTIKKKTKLFRDETRKVEQSHIVKATANQPESRV